MNKDAEDLSYYGTLDPTPFDDIDWDEDEDETTVPVPEQP